MNANSWYLLISNHISWLDIAVLSSLNALPAPKFFLWSGLERLVPVMNKTLKPEEMLKVAYIFARGGRFEDATNAYTNETISASLQGVMPRSY